MRLETMMVYLLGMGVLFVLLVTQQIPQNIHVLGHLYYLAFPVTAFILYISLTGYVFFMYLTPYLQIVMPTSVILESFTKKPKQTDKDLESLFKEDEVITKRLHDLGTFGFVAKQNDTYTVTTQGKVLFWIVRIYEIVFVCRVGG